MKAYIHKSQQDFIDHPATQAAINGLLFIATGGIEGAVSLTNVGKSLFNTKTVYRVFGGEAKALGRSWTPINPANISNYRNIAGLPNSNTGQFVIEGTIKEFYINSQRSALKLHGNQGGLLEYIIKKPSKVQINRISGVNPQF